VRNRVGGVLFHGALLAIFAASVHAQTGADGAVPWKRIAGTTINEGLAGPATGPVRSVWYGARGGRLLVQTAAGRVFETSDFEHWRINTTDSVPAVAAVATGISLPEAGAKMQAAGPRVYASGANNIYVWDDGGRAWLNLTGFNGRSILGGGFSGLAVSPANSQEIAAANEFGVWRSLDGGLSWHSLNKDLPNLPAYRLVDRRTLAMPNSSLAAIESGAWTQVAGTDPEATLRARLGTQSRLAFSAVARSGSVIYGGTADGRLLTSRDEGATWTDAPRATANPIARIWSDGERPETALAAAGSRLLRTINGGGFWDDVTGALPPAQIHGIAADRNAGRVYVATDRGIFAGDLSLNDAGPGASNWRPISRELPAANAWDIRLNADNTLTVLLDGYGVYEAPAPHRPRSPRLVSGADMTERPAAPGALISILGASVRGGRSGELAYPVLAASAQSSQLQVPFESAAGIFQLALEGEAGRWTLPVTVKEAAPAIFVDGEGAPLLLDSESGLVLDPSLAVRAGSSIQILTTGLGKVTPDWPTGVPAPLDSPPAVRGTVTAFLDGIPVEVTRATLAPGYVGYYTVELRIPAVVNRGVSDLRIVMNGEESNRVKLFLEPDRAE